MFNSNSIMYPQVCVTPTGNTVIKESYDKSFLFCTDNLDVLEAYKKINKYDNLTKLQLLVRLAFNAGKFINVEGPDLTHKESIALLLGKAYASGQKIKVHDNNYTYKIEEISTIPEVEMFVSYCIGLILTTNKTCYEFGLVKEERN
ncbi:hypothetical protein SSRV2_ORF47 [Saccharolobus shibatae rod virus 2]|nr:hypothetical protein [Saccharolobus shibatae filamentous virus 3]WHA35222.1 hypothetical protein SSRV2_ORF47 [Saccharolobus shibatae rod virus 2]